MHNFKVGDRVVLVKPDSDDRQMGLQKNQEFTIVSLDSGTAKGVWISSSRINRAYVFVRQIKLSKDLIEQLGDDNE